MKLTLFLLLLSFSLVAQNKLSVLGGVSYSPMIVNGNLKAYSNNPSVNLSFGGEEIQIETSIGSVSKLGVKVRKWGFVLGFNIGLDFNYINENNNSPMSYGDIDIGVEIPFSNKSNYSFYTGATCGINLRGEIVYSPFKIGVYKKFN